MWLHSRPCPPTKAPSQVEGIDGGTPVRSDRGDWIIKFIAVFFTGQITVRLFPMPPPSPGGARNALTLDIKGRIVWLLKPSTDSSGHSLAYWVCGSQRSGSRGVYKRHT